MRTFHRYVLVFLCASSAALEAAATPSSASGVEVQVAPIKVERRIFDPSRPPTDLPKLTPPEVAACVFNLACRVEGTVQGKRLRRKSPPPTVTQLTFFVEMLVTIWLPTNSTPKIERHEEAHRRISEHYYARAKPIALRLGRAAIASAVDASASSESSMRKGLETLQGKLVNEFMRQLADRCLFAQARFDELTEHGTNSLAESVAMTRAIASEQAAPDAVIPRSKTPRQTFSTDVIPR